MAFRVAIVLDHLDQFGGDLTGAGLHGANLALRDQIRQFACSPAIEAIEIFLPSGLVAQGAVLEAAARFILPEHRRGQGLLTFYPLPALPEIWADGAERILWCVDPELAPRNRYLRDAFAVGPTPLAIDTHAFGTHPVWDAFARLASAPPAPYDTLFPLSRALEAAMRVAAAEFRLDIGLVVNGRAVDLETFHPPDAAERRAARAMISIPDSARVALYFGRLSPHAKADLLPLVDCFAEMAKADDLLLIAGVENVKGYGDLLAARAAELGIGAQVQVHQEVPPGRRHRVFAAADVFVFPGDTVQEALGNTVLEAMASGLPVIASDWDGLRDMVSEGETGRLIPTRMLPCYERPSRLSPASFYLEDYLALGQTTLVDRGALAQALGELLHDPGQAARMGAAGRRWVEARASGAIITRGLTDAWAAMMETARRESPEAARVRREFASTLGRPIPFARVFRGYGTSVFDLEQTDVRLTPFGKGVLDGVKSIGFYDDLLPILRPTILDGVMRALVDGRTRRLADLAAELAPITPTGVEDVLFHVGVLAKRGVVALCS